MANPGRRPIAAGCAVLVAATIGVSGCASDSPPTRLQPPPLHLGLDAYLHLDKLSYLDVGTRVRGWATSDPAGSNLDHVNNLGQLPGGGRVLFDQVGPGVLTFLRMQQEIGAPWDLTVDGAPAVRITPGDLGTTGAGAQPAAGLPYPLSLNRAQTQGTNIIATPIAFAQRLTFSSTAANGNFYSLFRRLPAGAALPQADEAKTHQVVRLLNSAGSDLVSRAGASQDITPRELTQRSGTLRLGSANSATTVVELTGPSQIRALTLRAPFEDKVRLGNSRLQIFWDGQSTPSVDAPVKFLTGIGGGVYQPADRQLVQGLLANTTSDGSTYLDFNLYWPMPFSSSARIVLVTGADPPSAAQWSVRHEPFPDPPHWWGTFHANHTEVGEPEPGRDMTFLQVGGSGKLVGTVVNFTHPGFPLEGDPRIYLDGSATPQIAVTGTEEWSMGGDYWNHGNQTSLPLAGFPTATTNPAGADVDGSAAYRFLIADAVTFNDGIRVDWEHGQENNVFVPYRATMMWYGRPQRSAVRTAEHVPAREASSYRRTAAYEYLPSSPPSTRTVSRATDSTFTMAIAPDNHGAFLRRTFDSCTAGQRAAVFVDGQPAGTWYNAGGRTIAGIDGNSRCWRDDDLPLPAALTAEKSAVEIRITALDGPHAAWTAVNYALYSFVIPAGHSG